MAKCGRWGCKKSSWDRIETELDFAEKVIRLREVRKI